MDISERSQEILEKYWIENKEKHTDWSFDIIQDDPAVNELLKGGYAVSSGGKLGLTETGWKEAQDCIRRHRLAECLLKDVLTIGSEQLHDIGCEFEHVLQKKVEVSICTLLGHPTVCPHGKPIPEGDCCRSNNESVKPFVQSLIACDILGDGQIAYIRSSEDHIINKLTSMGVIPGLKIQLLKKKPSFLFKIGESQFAMDRELASKIYVRLI